MGKFESPKKQQNTVPQFVLVLARKEIDWLTATQLLEGSGSDFIASYYLVEQIDELHRAGLLQDYCACLVVDNGSFDIRDHTQLELLCEELPMVLIKKSHNIHDLALEKLAAETITPKEFGHLALVKKMRSSHHSFQCLKFSGRTDKILKTVSGSNVYQSAIDTSDACNAESIVSDVVESLRLIARTRGVDLNWQPTGEEQFVRLNRQEVKRAIMGLLLELFEYYGGVKLKIAPSSLLSDRCIWLDINANQLRGGQFDRDFLSEFKDSLQKLRTLLHSSQGQLFILDHGPRTLCFRIEWLAFDS
ncbi:MAG: hypothetical protein MI867_29575 [Pseudomonadales bacterium]|nr:hypothetical protein [Pseudomonadales bacterium]